MSDTESGTVAASDASLAVRMAGVSKQFGGVRALESVDFAVRFGEIHALLGENGAGKSTILKILSGVQAPSAGTVEIAGLAVTDFTPRAAQAAGVTMIFQETSLVPTLTVAQNIFLTREVKVHGLIDDRAAAAKARDLFAELGVDIDPNAAVGELGAGQRQLTEIVKAWSQNPRVLILDEPTSALSGNEVERLFAHVRRLKSQGLAIIYVSHRMDEIFRLADRATILRDGRHVSTGAIAGMTLEGMIADIVGRRSRGFSDVARHKAEIGEAILEARGLSGRHKPRDVDLVLRRGEVVGIAGLLGSGRSSLARLLAGIEPITAGEIRVRGRPIAIASPRDAIAAGIALVPEDRGRQGFVAAHSITSNVALPNLDRLSDAGWVSARRTNRLVDDAIQRLRIRTPSRDNPVRNLSGGNAQKVVIAKWLAAGLDVLVLDEPTAGIDIGSKAEIVTLVRELARQGKAILVLSSELQELLAACDRILVMSEGRIVREIARDELDDPAESAGGDALHQAEQRLQKAVQQARGHAV
ncbi:sugar ABC transporter ATP-binding protein [Labrys wisconsinensis]|uniref:Ribose transport system ATP-binding protein n=1 Tax=Labrys wisconsinensis TaxID=425677 RepID=A0ABU0JFU7_9HYPH|nr:sugar ABC transporter ATP-binding protein [Labrys wisconsinensis]MDQ0473153.1 ribose transport system ATP-binding protein [Labrys wisconsinensis]